MLILKRKQTKKYLGPPNRLPNTPILLFVVVDPSPVCGGGNTAVVNGWEKLEVIHGDVAMQQSHR